MQREDGGPWIHVMIIGHGTDGHNVRSYQIRMTKVGCAVIGKRDIKLTSISAEDFLWNEMAKAN